MMLLASLNAILCCAILVMVVCPLAWTILTQRRDRLAAGGAASGAPAAAPQGTRDSRRYPIISAVG